MSQNIPVIAIIGRTNVGKSTLFNALAGRRIAVVEDSPGVTRDRNYHLVRRFDFPFTIIDTGGLLGDEQTELQRSVRAQSELAIAEADLVLAVFDGKYGPHPFDGEVVEALRRSGKAVLWVVNKCEKQAWATQATEFYRYGLDKLELVSAANHVGIKELVATIGEKTNAAATKAALIADEDPENAPIRVAIVGRPNVGKSTLINKLIGEERLVASPLPGTTRDSVDIEFNREGQRFVLVDTAGLRKKSRVDAETAERYANLRSLSALATCDVAVLLVDAEEGMPTDQDIRIATLIHERGRAFVIAINKWDAIEKDNKTAKQYENVVREAFNFARYAPILYISAKTGKRCPTLFDTVKDVHASAQLTIEPKEFQNALWEAVKRNLPPVYHGRPIKFVGAMQVGTNPPTFEILVSHPPGLTDTYIRYLKSRLREKFPFPGSDMRLLFKKKTRKAAARDAEKADDAAMKAGVPTESLVQEWDL